MTVQIPTLTTAILRSALTRADNPIDQDEFDAATAELGKDNPSPTIMWRVYFRVMGYDVREARDKMRRKISELKNS